MFFSFWLFEDENDGFVFVDSIVEWISYFILGLGLV